MFGRQTTPDSILWQAMSIPSFHIKQVAGYAALLNRLNFRLLTLALTEAHCPGSVAGFFTDICTAL
jgi:hypothetical protein